MIRAIKRMFKRAPTGDTVITIDKAEMGLHPGLHKQHVGISSKDENDLVMTAIEFSLHDAMLRGVSPDHPEIVAHRAELKARRALAAGKK